MVFAALLRKSRRVMSDSILAFLLFPFCVLLVGIRHAGLRKSP